MRPVCRFRAQPKLKPVKGKAVQTALQAFSRSYVFLSVCQILQAICRPALSPTPLWINSLHTLSHSGILSQEPRSMGGCFAFIPFAFYLSTASTNVHILSSMPSFLHLRVSWGLSVFAYIPWLWISQSDFNMLPSVQFNLIPSWL